MKNYLIVGGVAGGATAAARLRRLDESARIILFERGQYVSFASCGLPYYVSETIKYRENLLVQTPTGMKSRFDLDVRTNSEVVAVDTKLRKVTVKHENSTYEEYYDELLLAPGAEPVRLDVPHGESFRILTLRNMSDVDKLKAFANDNEAKSVVVIGGGFVGVEVAENLKKCGLDVTIVEAAPHILMPFDDDMVSFIERDLVKNGIKVLLNHKVTAFNMDGGNVTACLSDGTEISADFVVEAIGLKSETAFLKDAGIELNERGYIKVDEELRTSAQHVFAVGDAITFYRDVDRVPMTLALAGPANHQGRRAADNMVGLHKRIRGFQGSSIIKVFNLTAAATGRNARTLERENVPFKTVICHPMNHASYYPGAEQLSLKVTFGMDGTLYGAQAVGGAGVDKRIDVLASMIRQGANVRDLIDLELCYSPPFSSAKDPVNIAGYMGEDVLGGLTEPVLCRELKAALAAGARLIDVRTAGEFEKGHFDEAENIPLDAIRNRLDEFKKEDDIIVYCQVGLRGYYAERLLKQRGFKARNLMGGWKLASAVFFDVERASRAMMK